MEQCDLKYFSSKMMTLLHGTRTVERKENGLGRLDSVIKENDSELPIVRVNHREERFSC